MTWPEAKTLTQQQIEQIRRCSPAVQVCVDLLLEHGRDVLAHELVAVEISMVHRAERVWYQFPIIGRSGASVDGRKIYQALLEFGCGLDPSRAPLVSEAIAWAFGSPQTPWAERPAEEPWRVMFRTAGAPFAPDEVTRVYAADLSNMGFGLNGMHGYWTATFLAIVGVNTPGISFAAFRGRADTSRWEEAGSGQCSFAETMESLEEQLRMSADERRRLSL